MKTSKKSIKTKTNKVVNILSTIIIAICVILIAGAVIRKVTGKNIFHYQIIWVMTDSMEEQIPKQSYILIRDATPDEVKVGDVITFISSEPELNNANNTHRVTQIMPDGSFKTKGDNCVMEDKMTAKAENLIGIYVCNLPLLTSLGRFFATKGGLFCSLGAIIAAFVLSILNSRKPKEEPEKTLDMQVEEEIQKLKEHPELLEQYKNKK